MTKDLRCYAAVSKCFVYFQFYKSQLLFRLIGGRKPRGLAKVLHDPVMAQKYRVLLPKTKFPLRANPAASEPQIRAAAGFDQLYQWQQDQRDRTDVFTLHDGPPYANGSPHMGHALNKTLKDIVNRYKLLRGYRLEFRPGWDCHGLPIELKALHDGSDDAATGGSAMEIRSKAFKFARRAIKEQKREFQKWGCLGDWENPYLTMDRKYEADQIGVFFEMYQKGCVYRGFKPVYWSPSSRTALAEAELEYNNHTSQSVYTLFPLVSRGSLDIGGSGELFALVWTTTPWTLAANRAICYHTEHSFTLLEILEGSNSSKVVLVGSKCLDKLAPLLGEHRVIGTVSGSQLEGVLYWNPVDASGMLRPFLPAQHVSDQEGTGLVHTAPSHGHEDYLVGVEHSLDLKCVVDGEGRFTVDAGSDLEGLDVLGRGNEVILAKLRGLGSLVHEHSYEHRYPYDWRTKKPVIIRATEQWFADVSSLKEQAKSTILNDVTMYPSISQNRLLPMLSGRDNWCISRQRLWGVPLPIFYHSTTGEPLISHDTITHVRALVGKLGSDCWWTLTTRELLPESLQSVSCEYTKGQDTMDVWFDSGSSWASVLSDVGGVADLYLEGSDQHRGWFQSSLLTSIAVRGRAPYKALLTHGFVLDKGGSKMSKSLGNVLSPDNILSSGKNFGADTMRLWVASSDYTSDVNISDEILSQNGEFLQKIRNTCRFMLGNLSDFTPEVDAVDYSRLAKLDQYALHLLSQYNQTAMSAYEEFHFPSLCHALANFLPDDLSSFYFYIVKDRLYCEGRESEKRRAVQTVLYHFVWTLIQSVGPILPHLAEEVAQYVPSKGQ